LSALTGAGESSKKRNVRYRSFPASAGAAIPSSKEIIMRPRTLLFLCCLLAFFVPSAFAAPTTITVRVKSKDAKFVGTTMGGALVTIKDAQTGELLAKGVTTGGTGNTEKIMIAPVKRGVPISDESAAQFTATIDIDEPRLVEVSAYGPGANLQAANKITETQWVVPGKNITQGDAWLLELPGFVVDILAPPAHSMQGRNPSDVEIRANVTMMCGCPITPGGLWDANAYEVAALLYRNGKRVGTLPLKFAGSVSQFSAVWSVTEPGTYQATVYAYDPATGNTGLDSTTFLIAP
jgi:hypothetical protein